MANDTKPTRILAKVYIVKNKPTLKYLINLDTVLKINATNLYT